MKEQVLLIPQMQELIKLGIDVSTASMHWRRTMNYMTGEWDSGTLMIGSAIGTYPSLEYIPTFTLQDILERLPSIKGYLPWDLHRCAGRNPYYMCVYEPCDLKHTSSKDWIKFTSETPLEAAFNMFKWCKQNNYI